MSKKLTTGTIQGRALLKDLRYFEKIFSIIFPTVSYSLAEKWWKNNLIFITLARWILRVKKWCIWFPKFGSRYQIFPWQVVWAVIHLLIEILLIGACVLYIESICKGGTQFLKISLLSFDNCWTRGYCWLRGHLSDMARGHFVRQGDMDNGHGNEQILGVYTRRTYIS